MSRKKTYQEIVSKTRKIFIIDDHPVVRRGLMELINQEKELIVCGEAENADEALQAIKTLEPDIAILDLSLMGRSGLDLIKDIKAQYPDLPILILSMHEESFYAERALRAGAKGYIMKQEAPEKVIAAIRKVLSNQIYVSDNMASKMINRLISNEPQACFSTIEHLSNRELEVFRLIGEGYETKHIAHILHLSIKTIETYRAHIKNKLNLKTSNELLKCAIEWIKSASTKEHSLD